MLEYYRELAFNPVLIRVEEAQVWQDHVRKRRHLYERHLGIPLPFLEGKRVLEFGCNSGENALVLATFGARMTFVEPNPLVAPRLEELFKIFGLGDRIEGFHVADIESFQTGDSFDLVIAEGFLCTLANRDQMLEKILTLVKPGGFGVISFNDRFGGLLEMLKRAILFRAYALVPLADIQSGQALAIAGGFFQEDFQRLNASRSFETWWRDTMVVPIYTDRYLWSYREILPLLEAKGFAVHATSPVWSTAEHFNWYKNVQGERNRMLLENWKQHLFYFLSGLRPNRLELESETPELVIEDTAAIIRGLSALADAPLTAPPIGSAPGGLLDHLRSHPDPRATPFAQELEGLFGLLASGSSDQLLRQYQNAGLLRQTWGTAYHYLCFQRQGA
jgi:SAM-dependent methyltransferase